MHRPFRGSAELAGENETFQLHLDIEMMIALQKETGMPLKLMLGQLELADMDIFARIFWVAAQRHQPNVKIKQIYEAMSDIGLEGMQAVLQELFKAVMPDKKEGEDGARPPKAARAKA